MSARLARRAPAALLLWALFGSAAARPLVEISPPGNGARRPTSVHEEVRVIAGHRGAPERLAFRLSLYGLPGPNLPVLVQVHEWGGDFAREEALAAYEPARRDFVMLSFQYEPATGNQDDWWFGTAWDGETHPWAHDALAAIVAETQAPGFVAARLPGVAVDADRYWLFGHSVGGTGAWQLGLRHPELFAAFHAHAGFARFTAPAGAFQGQFERDIVGTAAQAWRLRRDGRTLPARDASDLSTWLREVRGAAAETPYVLITHATGDTAVPIESGGDLMLPVLDAQRRGFSYLRTAGSHASDCFVGLDWLWNFRRDQSFLAFTHRQGYGAPTGGLGRINDLTALSWNPETIVDAPDDYEVTLVGTGTADVTLRRLQRLRHAPGDTYTLYLDVERGEPARIAADADGLITLPGLQGGHRVLLHRLGPAAPASR